jgi:EpsI family protein
MDTMFLGSLGLREAIDREYWSEVESVALFVAVGGQSAGRRGLFSPKTGLPGSGWVVEDRWTAPLGSRGRPVAARILRRETQRRLVYHWYEGTAGFADEAWRSLLALDATPWRRDREAAVIRLTTELSGPGAEARREAEERMARFYRLLEEPLGRIDARLVRKTFS